MSGVSMHKRVALIVVVALATGGPLGAFEAPPSYAIGVLERLGTDIQRLQFYAHQDSQPRLYILETAIQELIQNVHQDVITSRKTIHLYERLLTRFTYSEDFFRFITAKRTAFLIQNMGSAILQVRLQIGVDDEPAGKTLEHHLLQVRTSLEQLLDRDSVDNKLRDQLHGLLLHATKTASLASLGDLEAAEAAQVFYKDCESHYPILNTFIGSEDLGIPAMEILGANEFIGSLTQRAFQSEADSE